MRHYTFEQIELLARSAKFIGLAGIITLVAASVILVSVVDHSNWMLWLILSVMLCAFFLCALLVRSKAIATQAIGCTIRLFPNLSMSDAIPSEHSIPEGARLVKTGWAFKTLMKMSSCLQAIRHIEIGQEVNPILVYTDDSAGKLESI